MKDPCRLQHEDVQVIVLERLLPCRQCSMGSYDLLSYADPITFGTFSSGNVV